MKFIPRYYADKVKIINPHGRAGIVTLWSDPEKEGGPVSTIKKERPYLMDPATSPLVALTSLYGNGLPHMLANLAYNPQVDRIAVTGTNLQGSQEALMGFFEQGVDEVQRGGQKFAQIKGTKRYIDPQLDPQLLKHVHVKRFDVKDLEGICAFVGSSQPTTYTEADRKYIELAKPAFTTFPSDVWNHTIVGSTPLEAWKELMHTIDVFGIVRQLVKGQRKSLFDVSVTVLNPAYEDKKTLEEHGIDPAKLDEYRARILDPSPGDQAYTYGSILASHFGGSALEAVIDRLKTDSTSRHAFISLWDTKKHLIEHDGKSSVPCLTDIYFINDRGNIALDAGFRTHNASSAWLPNLYMLRAIQEHIADKANIQPGLIKVRSRDIGIDPDNDETIAALATMREKRKARLDVNDPRGYFSIDVKDKAIVVEQFDGETGSLLRTIEGSSAKEIKDKMRELRAVQNPDHALYIGHKLAAAEFKLTGEVSELR